jgi:hypothetical protein
MKRLEKQREKAKRREQRNFAKHAEKKTGVDPAEIPVELETQE